MLWQRREILVVERFSPLHLVSRGHKDHALKLAVGFRLYLNRKKLFFSSGEVEKRLILNGDDK